ncbi:hypothetical protein, partial [Nocardia farcinica]|uniref:hypothetical protein n=1 Tax=Nocardia farcinica TaxID=37329 RepID=UPI003D78EA4A
SSRSGAGGAGFGGAGGGWARDVVVGWVGGRGRVCGAVLAAELGVGAVVTDAFEGDAHTSALTAAFVAAREAGLTDRPLLWVAADGGPTAAAVTYRGAGVR